MAVFKAVVVVTGTEDSRKSPLLFLIYINELTNVELNDGNLLLYADDILLYHPIYCLDDY